MATDRYRLAVRDLTWEPTEENYSARILVRAARLSDIAKSLGSVGKVEVSIDTSGRAGMVSFAAAGRRSVARLIDGEYPPVRNLFPSDTNGYAIVRRQELLDAIKRARLVVEKNSAVRLSFTEGQVVLEAGQGDNAQTSEALEAALVGEDIAMAFNPSFLQEGMECQVALFNDAPISIEIQQRVTLEITETEPAIKNQTASSSFKPAVLSNGVRTMVPPHITAGTRIVVDTSDSSYVERAKD